MSRPLEFMAEDDPRWPGRCENCLELEALLAAKDAVISEARKLLGINTTVDLAGALRRHDEAVSGGVQSYGSATEPARVVQP